MQYLKQSTAATVKLGPFVDDSDGKTAETGLTISQADIRLSKNGGAFAQTNDATGATHDENGWYGVPLDTTDTNTLGRLQVAVAESGALPVWREFMVVPANTYDSLVSGSDYLDANAAQVEGSDATDQIRDAVVDDAERIDGSALNGLSGKAPSAGYLLGSANADGSGYSTHGDPDPSGYLDAAVSSRSSHAAADIWSVGTRTLTSFGTLVQDIWDKATSALTTVGSIGKLLADYVDAAISSRSSHDDPDPSGYIDAAISGRSSHSAADVTGGTTVAQAETNIRGADSDTLKTLSDEIAALNDLSAAEVNAEVVDALNVDTLSELSQAAPPATPTHRQAVMALYMALRNKLTVDADYKTVHNDAGTAVFKKGLSDDGTTYTEAEAESGA